MNKENKMKRLKCYEHIMQVTGFYLLALEFCDLVFGSGGVFLVEPAITNTETRLACFLNFDDCRLRGIPLL